MPPCDAGAEKGEGKEGLGWIGVQSEVEKREEERKKDNIKRYRLVMLEERKGRGKRGIR